MQKINPSFRILSAFAIIFVVAGHADFGVFDIAERWFIDNGINGIQDLFFYNITDTDIINFRRFIV